MPVPVLQPRRGGADAARDAAAAAAANAGEGEDSGPGTASVKAACALFFFLNFFCRGMLAVVESKGALLYTKTFEGPRDPDITQDVSIYFFVFGLLGLGTFAAMPFVKRRFSTTTTLVVGLLALGFGCALFATKGLAPDPAGESGKDLGWEVRAALGTFCIWSFSTPVTSVVVIAAFSSLLGSKGQGVAMGAIGAAGSAGRILLPLLSNVVSDWTLLFATLSGLAFLSAISVAGFSGMCPTSERRIGRRAAQQRAGYSSV